MVTITEICGRCRMPVAELKKGNFTIQSKDVYGVVWDQVCYCCWRKEPWISRSPKWIIPEWLEKYRWVHKWYARLNGYFWKECPMCGRMFGGHEQGGGVLMINESRGEITCPECPGTYELNKTSDDTESDIIEPGQIKYHGAITGRFKNDKA